MTDLGAPALAVDLGGTNMRAAVVGPDGTILRRCARPTPRDAACPEALEDLIAEVRVDEAISHAVIGLPGRVDYDLGRLETAPNLPPSWVADLAGDELAAVLGMPVLLANDADLAAVGEASFGAGRGWRDIAYVTLSTGVGAAVVFDGAIVHGRRSLAELGHTILDRAAAAIGGPATVEALGSGTALGRMARAAGLPEDGAELVQLVAAGDEHAARVWATVVRAAAYGIVNLVHLFSPEIVIIGGGFGRNGSLVLDPVRTELDRFGPAGLPEPIALVEAALGDDAALVGAASWRAACAAWTRKGLAGRSG
jgi:glucokinase